MKIFENLVKVEDFWKILPKLKIFQILVKIEDFSNFGKNWRFLKIWDKVDQVGMSWEKDRRVL